MNFIELRPGISVEESEIKAYRSDLKSPSYIYFIAGTHGDEVEGVYVLDRLFDWLKEDEQIEEFPLIIIPTLNVDGLRASTRGNAHGIDLNRNYPTQNWKQDYKQEKYNPGPQALSEPENQYLDKLFKKFKPKLIISFHSWKPMINYNGGGKNIADFLEKYNNYQAVDEIKGHHTPGSLGEYGPEAYNCPVITFECPTLKEELGLKKIWEENKIALQKLFTSTLLTQSDFK